MRAGVRTPGSLLAASGALAYDSRAGRAAAVLPAPAGNHRWATAWRFGAAAYATPYHHPLALSAQPSGNNPRGSHHWPDTTVVLIAWAAFLLLAQSSRRVPSASGVAQQ